MCRFPEFDRVAGRVGRKVNRRAVSTFAWVQPVCFWAVRNITLPRLLALHDMTGDKIVVSEIDPSFVVTHPASLEDAPEM